MIRLLNWFRRRSLERGLDRELQYHYDRRVADLIAAGIPEPEARRLTATDPATITAAAMVLAAGALSAAFIPAWLASNVSPTDALRLE
jgi:fatty acid desaturase